MRTPRDALGDRLPSNASCAKPGGSRDDKDSEENSDESFETSLSLTERRVHQSAIGSCSGYDTMDESASSDDEKSELQFQRAHQDSVSDESLHSEPENGDSGLGSSSMSRMHSHKGEQHISCLRNTNINQLRRVPRAFWPVWVYRMYDSYCLAQKAAGTLTLLFLLVCWLQIPDFKFGTFVTSFYFDSLELIRTLEVPFSLIMWQSTILRKYNSHLQECCTSYLEFIN